MTNKSLTLAQAREIQNLNAEIERLRFIVKMAEGTVEEAKKQEALNRELAAENAMLMVKLCNLNPDATNKFTELLQQYPYSGTLAARVSSEGYQQAIGDVQRAVRFNVNPEVNDFCERVLESMNVKVKRLRGAVH